jgi:ubiquinone/menaquinone biosynthesis C-methylase UbiE
MFHHQHKMFHSLRRHFFSTKISPNIQAIQHEFKRQAKWFETNWDSRSTVSTSTLMDWVQHCLHHHRPLTATDRVLDVACGTGIFARSVASSVPGINVIGLDATPEMLDQAQTKINQEHLQNQVTLVQGDAASLPFPDHAFDLVTSRLAIHHFSHPPSIVREMARVVKPGGRVVVVDIVSSNVDAHSQEHNRLETLRDPTHVFAYPVLGLIELLEKEGGLVVGKSPNDIPAFENPMDLSAWMSATNTPPHAAIKIEQSIGSELKGGTKTGMRPYYHDDDGSVHFVHQYVTVQADKKDVGG